MFKLTQSFRDGAPVTELQILCDWKNPDEEEKEVSKNLTFNIKTYTSLKQNFHTIMKPVFDFFKTLSDQDKKELFNMFYKVKYIEITNNISATESKNINFIENDNDFNEFNNNINQCIEKLSNVILESLDKIDLINKIKCFVIKNIELPDLSHIGTRPQDSSDTTFYKDDYIELTTLSIMCKMLCPIFGEIIYWFNKSAFLDKTTKEIHAIKILEKVISKYFSFIIEKLLHYIDTRLSALYSNDDINTLFKGYDEFKLKLYIYSTILCKKLVNINLFNKTRNIVTYIYSCIIDTCRSQLKSLKKDDKIMERFENSGGEDDIDLLEHETGRNIQKIGTLLFIRKCVDGVINTIVKNHGLDTTLLEKMYKWYLSNNVDLTIFNEFIIAMVLSKYLGCGNSIRYISIHQFVQILSCIQLVLVNQYKNGKMKSELSFNKELIPELVYLLSSKHTGIIKTKKEDVDFQLRFAPLKKEDYKIINEKLEHIDEREEWKTVIQEMSDNLVLYYYEYCCYPDIFKILGEDKDINHEYLKYRHEILSGIIRLGICDLGIF